MVGISNFIDLFVRNAFSIDNWSQKRVIMDRWIDFIVNFYFLMKIFKEQERNARS
jgi:hypothetical protein